MSNTTEWLETNYDGISRCYGVMFDVKSETDMWAINITNLSLHAVKSKKLRLWVWAKEGSFQVGPGKSNKWRSIVTMNQFQGMGQQSPSLVTNMEPLLLEPKSSVALWITFNTRSMFCTDTPRKLVGHKIISNNDASLHTGRNLGEYPFSGSDWNVENGLWNGGIGYELLPPNPTSVPSIFPSLIHTRYPSVHPTIGPTRRPSTVPTSLPISISVSPSETFSSKPSFKPSHYPTTHQSLTPSINMSANPSGTLSSKPTLKPSPNPTTRHSHGPSLNLSYNPSLMRSLTPTIEASHRPSIYQSSYPSETFSARPTYESSHHPTLKFSSKPTLKSSMMPTSNPTKIFSITEVIYKFRLEHSEQINLSELLKKINETVKSVLTHSFSKSEVMKRKIKSGALSWSNPDSFIRGNTGSQPTTCDPLVNDAKCFLVDTSIKITYASALFKGEEMRFIFLKFAEDISAGFDFGLQSDYDGPEPEKSNSMITLHNFELENLYQGKGKHFFEETVRHFLNKSLERINPSLVVSLVKIIDDGNTKVREVDLEASPQYRRKTKERQRKSKSHFTSVDVPITILGEYEPPPDIDFDTVVQESFTNDADILVEDLKTDKRFATVERAASRPVIIEEVEVYGEILSPKVTDNMVADRASSRWSFFSFMYSPGGLVTYSVSAFFLLVSLLALFRIGAKALEKKKRQADRLKFFSSNEMMVFGSPAEEEEAQAIFGASQFRERMSRAVRRTSRKG